MSSKSLYSSFRGGVFPRKSVASPRGLSHPSQGGARAREQPYKVDLVLVPVSEQEMIDLRLVALLTRQRYSFSDKYR